MQRAFVFFLAIAPGLWGGLLAQLNGSADYFVNGTSNPSARQFATLDEAFTALENQGVDGSQGPINIRVVDGYNPASEPSTIHLEGYECIGGSCPPVNVYVEVSSLATISKAPVLAARYVLRLGGSTNPSRNLINFRLYGRGKLRLVETTPLPNATAVLGITPGPSQIIQSVVIDSLLIDGNLRTETFAGIYVGDHATLPSPVSPTAEVRNLVISNCQIVAARHGIYLQGRRVISPQVIGCTVGIPEPVPNTSNTDRSFGGFSGASSAGGIYFAGTSGGLIAQNIIRNSLQNTTPLDPGFAGIIADTVSNLIIERNRIYNIRYTGTGGYGCTGIRVNALGASPANVTIRNNFISRIGGDGDNTTSTFLHWMVTGIAIHATASNGNVGVQIIHNTIHLFNDSDPSYGPSDAGTSEPLGFTNSVVTGIVTSSNVTGGVNLFGNIIQNTHRRRATNARAFGVIIIAPLASWSGFFELNYNAYLIESTSAGGDFIGRVGTTTYATLADWQGILGFSPDLNSISLFAEVPFLSNYDLHINPTSATQVINAGDAAYNGVLNDFDGQSRPLPNPGPGANGDLGTRPDIGADEVDGTAVQCFAAVQAPEIQILTPPNAGTAYIWGSVIQVGLAPASPTPVGLLRWIYSLDGGTTWIVGRRIRAFPATFSLPPFTPPTYTATLLLGVRAENIPNCLPLLSDDSDNPVPISLTDRPGNRLATAIPITLTYNAATQRWQATIADSLNGPAMSNEYGVSGATGFTHPPRGSGSVELFYRLRLPACLDSLILNTCNEVPGFFTGFDTYVGVINLTLPDTTADDDQGSTTCTSTQLPSYAFRGFTSQIQLIGRASSAQMRPFTESGSSPTRDTMRLARGDELIVIVEAYSSFTSPGRFLLTIEGYGNPVRAKPNLGPDVEVCEDGANSLSLNATTTGATTYEWVVNGSVVSGATGPTYALPLTPGTWTVIARAIFTNARGTLNGSMCLADTTADTIVVNVAAQPPTPPTPNLGPDQVVCIATGSLNFSVAAGADQYEWLVDNNLEASGPSNTFTFNFPGVGTYLLKVRAINLPPANSPCSPVVREDEVQITVTDLASPPPPMFLGGNRTVCVTTGSISFTAPGGAQSYQWFVDGQIQAGFNTNTFTFNFTTPGSYTVRVRAVNSPPPGSVCGQAVSEDQITVTVTPAASPTPMDLGPDQVLCLSDGSVSLSVQAGAEVYEWFLNGALQAGATTNTFTLNFSSPGTYLVKVRSTNNPPAGSVCTDQAISEDEVRIDVTDASAPPPTMNLGPDQNVCVLDGSLLLRVASGAQTYEWFVNGQLQPSATTNTYLLTFSTSGQYIVSVRATNAPPPGSVCPSLSSEDEVVITASDPPSAPPTMNLGGNRTVCTSQGSITFTVAGGAQTYEWYVDGLLQSGAGTNTFTLPVTIPGTYTVRVRAVNNPPPGSACGDPLISEDQIQVYVTEGAPLPPPVSLGPDRTLCLSEGSTTFSVASGAQAYRWFVDGQLQAGANTSTFTFSFALVGTYTIKVQALNMPPAGSLCDPAIAEDEVVVVVEGGATPPPPMNLGSDRSVCLDAGSLALSVLSGADSYQWFVNGQLQPGAQTNIFTFPLTAPGSYTIKVQAINTPPSGSACTAPAISEDEVIITVLPSAPTPPLMNLGPDQEVCVLQGSVSFSVSGGADTYEWIVNGRPISNATGNTFTLNFALAGTYTVTVRAINFSPSGSGCPNRVSEDEVQISVRPAPEAAIRVGTMAYSNGSTYYAYAPTLPISVTFEATSALSGNTYAWELYETGGSTPIAIGTASSFSHTFTQYGIYTLRLVSTNGPCTEEDTLFVNVNPTTVLRSEEGDFVAFPNPNSGTFTVKAPTVGSYHLRLLDIMGKEVYTDKLVGDIKEMQLRLPAGTYQLLISGEGRVGLLRLVIVE
ncbi:MAG: T9SS type A sorting domain-containing protein [Bacteroidia bacterium]|nr:T9SS type A sorting domain-containing protein [Bacteroidia bacterium]